MILELTKEKELEVLSSNLQYLPRGIYDVEDYLTIDNRTSIELLGNYLFYYIVELKGTPVCVIFFMKGKGLKSIYTLYKKLLSIGYPVIYTGNTNVLHKHSREIGYNIYELIN